MDAIIVNMDEYKVAVVLLTWRRLPNLKKNLSDLRAQTYKDFDVIVSNGNVSERSMRIVETFTNYFSKNGLRITVRHDGNDLYAFRRFTVGKDLAEQGYDIIMFIDDDVKVPRGYIEKCLIQYEPKSYKSGFAWVLHHKGSNYYKHRTRKWDNEEQVHYCGTGFSMIDASIFLDPGLIKKAPESALKIEDLWLSYYAQHVKGWKLAYMECPGVELGGSDSVALFKQIQSDPVNKTDFLHKLVRMGWKLPD